MLDKILMIVLKIVHYCVGIVWAFYVVAFCFGLVLLRHLDDTAKVVHGLKQTAGISISLFILFVIMALVIETLE